MWTCRDIRAGLNSGEGFCLGVCHDVHRRAGSISVLLSARNSRALDETFPLAKQQPGFLLVFREGLCARQSQAAEQDNKA